MSLTTDWLKEYLANSSEHLKPSSLIHRIIFLSDSYKSQVLDNNKKTPSFHIGGIIALIGEWKRKVMNYRSVYATRTIVFLW